MAEKKYLDLVGLKHFKDKLDEVKANIESPEFSGTPTAPTAEQGTSTQQIATTAFVNSELQALFSWGALGQAKEEG